MKEKPDTWWGDFTIALGATALWEIGPKRLAIQRQSHQWLVAHHEIENEENPGLWHFTTTNDDLNVSKYESIARYVSQSTSDSITVRPALADRSVVSRPFTPITVPVDEIATIHISTPLWFVMLTGSPPQVLFEHPIQRPSDTWFGPSTLEGETCYASRSHARLNRDNLTVHPFRAITQVNIHNKATTPLLVERLNIPVPYLSLYHTGDGLTWTETVTVSHSKATSMDEFNIEELPPSQAVGGELIAPPRIDPGKGMLIRAFGALKLQGFD